MKTWTPQYSIRLDRAAQPFYLGLMCGRFTQHLSWAEIHRLADLIGQPRNLAPRFNIAPTTPIEVVRAGEAGNELIPMRWGLVPSWWKKSLSELPSTFNARAETVTEKPMFRAAFKARRCIIPTSGFYEWTGKAGAKTPHYFSAPSGEPLALAGLWERWRDPESDASFELGDDNRRRCEQMDEQVSRSNADHPRVELRARLDARRQSRGAVAPGA